ncbi:MAG: hypothetical protein MJ127_05050 [Mogibacterium sp.]|nr:hypothetical protein [Mogibacterium sp.]
MEIKCDHCGVVAETIMPETVKDGEVEHTFFRCSDCGAVYPISATDNRRNRKKCDIGLCDYSLW